MLSWNFKIISVNFMFPLYIVMPALDASRASLVAQMVIRLQCRRPRFDSWVDKVPWRTEWQPTPGFLPGKFLKSQTQLRDFHFTSNTSKNFLTPMQYS